MAAGLAACGEGAGGATPGPTGASATSTPGSSSGPPGGAHSSGSTGSTGTGSSAASTTTIPVGLPSSPKLAASVLLDEWVAGDRKGAERVASADAVGTLFAAAYAGQPLVPRGCSRAGRSPVTCVYGPAGRIAPTSPTYRLVLLAHAGGWYVAKVVVVPPAPPGTAAGADTG